MLRPGRAIEALSRGPWQVGTLARVAQPKRVRLQVERLFDRHEAPARGCASRAVRRLVGHATPASRVLNQDLCCSRVLNQNPLEGLNQNPLDREVCAVSVRRPLPAIRLG